MNSLKGSLGRTAACQDNVAACGRVVCCTNFDSLQRRAFGLIETVVATVLVAITLVASLNSLAFVLKTTQHQAHTYRASLLAQTLLAEITAQPFEDSENASGVIGLESDELAAQRPQWDDCDDYHGWSSTHLVHRDGQPWLEASGWNVDVDVTYVHVNDPNLVSAASSTLKRIRLTLTSPSAQNFVFDALRSAQGALLEPQYAGQGALADVAIVVQGPPHGYVSGTRVHNQQESN
jgi:MSHA pilin protein MshD